MKGKNKLLVLGLLFFLHASVYLPLQSSPRYSLLAKEVHVEIGSKTSIDPYQYLLRNRQPLNEQDKEKFTVDDQSNLEEIGDYKITYNDQHTLHVLVEDTTAPMLSLSAISLQKGDSFSWDEKTLASVIDNVSDNYTDVAVLEKNMSCEDIDTNEAGEKEVSCSVKDESGNRTEAKLHVAVQAQQNSAPIIQKKPATSVASMRQTIYIPGAGYSGQEISEIQEVANLVNQIRAEHGLAPLSLDMGNYHNVTFLRAQEVLQSYSHTRPNGHACYTIFGDYGLGYTSSGENIAQGQQTPQEVVNDWMNSPTHRDNILRGEFTTFSIGVAGSGYDKVWVQEFFS